MKKLTLKKLSLAVLTAASILSIGSVAAAPKVTVKLTIPKGTAGDDKAVTSMYKGVPWLPCSSAAATFGGTATTAFNDKIQVDLDVSNPDDNKDTNKLSDYDLYVFFINYSASGARTTTGTAQLATDHIYALKPGVGLAAPTLAPYENASSTRVDDLSFAGTAPSTYRFMANTDFNEPAFKSTVFGGPFFVDTATLPQGMWGVVAMMVDPAVVVPGTTTTANSTKLQDPQNWSAWSMQPFILGTPFRTAIGVGVTGVLGAGTCL
jgi:hypothetical protein